MSKDEKEYENAKRINRYYELGEEFEDKAAELDYVLCKIKLDERSPFYAAAVTAKVELDKARMKFIEILNGQEGIGKGKGTGI